MGIKKICVIFLLISALILSTSFAGRRSSFVINLRKEVGAPHEEVSSEQLQEEEENGIHERLLKVNTKDYGRNDPAPALVKPAFKLIPN